MGWEFNRRISRPRAPAPKVIQRQPKPPAEQPKFRIDPERQSAEQPKFRIDPERQSIPERLFQKVDKTLFKPSFINFFEKRFGPKGVKVAKLTVVGLCIIELSVFYGFIEMSQKMNLDSDEGRQNRKYMYDNWPKALETFYGINEKIAKNRDIRLKDYSAWGVDIESAKSD